jgi:hypothetical protein
MAADAEESPDLDVQDFRLSWELNLPRKATEDRSRAGKRIATTPVRRSHLDCRSRAEGWRSKLAERVARRGGPHRFRHGTISQRPDHDGVRGTSPLSARKACSRRRSPRSVVRAQDAGTARFAARSSRSPARGCSVDSRVSHVERQGAEPERAGCVAVGEPPDTKPVRDVARRPDGYLPHSNWSRFDSRAER